MYENLKIRLALADDHRLIREGIIQLLNLQGCFEVAISASDGVELLTLLKNTTISVDICIIDINLPNLNGYETIKELNQDWPKIKTIALSMHNDDFSVIKMLKNGVKAFLLKDCHPDDLFNTIINVYEQDFFPSEWILQNFSPAKKNIVRLKNNILTEHEEEFIKLCCTELTYKEIAAKMNIGRRTIDNYRDSVFLKLELSSRVEIVIFALRVGLVSFKNKQFKTN